MQRASALAREAEGGHAGAALLGGERAGFVTCHPLQLRACSSQPCVRHRFGLLIDRWQCAGILYLTQLVRKESRVLALANARCPRNASAGPTRSKVLNDTRESTPRYSRQCTMIPGSNAPKVRQTIHITRRLCCCPNACPSPPPPAPAACSFPPGLSLQWPLATGLSLSVPRRQPSPRL